jgi:hypothetical protein
LHQPLGINAVLLLAHQRFAAELEEDTVVFQILIIE